MKKKKNQTGQALIESVVALPVTLFFLTFLIASMVIFGLRIHVLFLTQELAACALSRTPIRQCHLTAQKRSRTTLQTWGFQDVQTESSFNKRQAFLQVAGTFGPFQLRWSFKEKAAHQDF